ncbi:MAG TPA: WxcM-like domain-containing protein [Sphingobacteriaceae bacterium]|nr:WxcM-like domain-containing protein [Sphingobacteriaceae bacterium]
MSVPFVIQGDVFNDVRGAIGFCNDFDMREVRRMYYISPASEKVIRAWQAHKKEKKWFLCTRGSVEVKLIKIDNFHNPSQNLPVTEFILHEDNLQILSVPGGFAIGIRTFTPDAKLHVYSNFTLKESINDDYRYDKDTWNVWAK